MFLLARSVCYNPIHFPARLPACSYGRDTASYSGTALADLKDIQKTRTIGHCKNLKVMVRTLGVGEHKPCQQDCLQLAIEGEPATVVANDT